MPDPRNEEAGGMAQDDVANLKKAREQLVGMRRGHVEALAAGYKRGQTERNIEKVVQIQACIEAIDQALKDAGPARQGPVRRRNEGNPPGHVSPLEDD